MGKDHRSLIGSLVLILLMSLCQSYASSDAMAVEVSGDYLYVLIEDGTEVEIMSYHGSEGSVVIPDAIDGRPVTSIGYNAFWDCTFLNSVTIPSTVRSIGDSAFSRSALTSVMIPDGVLTIGNHTFLDCYYITSVVLSETLTSIGEGAFEACNSLTSITIPSNVTSLGPLAFHYCTSLNGIDVSEDNIQYLGVDGVVYGHDMSVLVQFPPGRAGAFTVPDGVKSIGPGAFASCGSLTSVNVSSGVTSIGSSAFSECTSLMEMRFDGNAPSCQEGWIDGHDLDMTVYYQENATGFSTPTWQGVRSQSIGESDEGTNEGLSEYMPIILVVVAICASMSVALLILRRRKHKD